MSDTVAIDVDEKGQARPAFGAKVLGGAGALVLVSVLALLVATAPSDLSQSELSPTFVQVELYVNPQDAFVASVSAGEDKIAYFGGKKNYYGIPIDVNHLIVSPEPFVNVSNGSEVLSHTIRTHFREVLSTSSQTSLLNHAFAGNTSLSLNWNISDGDIRYFVVKISTSRGSVTNTKTFVDDNMINVAPIPSSKSFDFFCNNYTGITVEVKEDDSELLGVYRSANGTETVRPSFDLGDKFHSFYAPKCDYPINNVEWIEELKQQSASMLEYTCSQVNYLVYLFEQNLLGEIQPLLNRNIDDEVAESSFSDIVSIVESWKFACQYESVVVGLQGGITDRRMLMPGKKANFGPLSPETLATAFLNGYVARNDLKEFAAEVIQLTLSASAGVLLQGDPIIALIRISELQNDVSCLVSNVIKLFLFPEGENSPSRAPAICNTLTFAGSLEPETRVYDLGPDTRKFKFTYDTQGVPDQIDIHHGPNTIYSTGCVGKKETVEIELSDYESSDITVEAIPNCGIPGNTGWSYIVECIEGDQIKCSEPFLKETECRCATTSGTLYPPVVKSADQVISVNGCGSDVKPLPCGLPNSAYNTLYRERFQAVCNEHDICYGECTKDRSLCDSEMCEGHSAICDELDDQGCHLLASITCKAVEYGASKAFIHAKNEYCTCN